MTIVAPDKLNSRLKKFGRRVPFFGGVVTEPAIVAPTSLTATATSSTTADLAWSWSGDEADIDGFSIERQLSTGGTWSEVATVGAAAREYENTGLSADTAYDWRARAFVTGPPEEFSAYSNVDSVTTAPDPIMTSFGTSDLSTVLDGDSVTVAAGGDLQFYLTLNNGDLLTSSDGDSWSRVVTDLTSVIPLSFWEEGNTYYLSGSGGLFVSTNLENWTEVPGLLTNTSRTIFGRNGTVLVVDNDNDTDETIIHKTTDGGGTWVSNSFSGATSSGSMTHDGTNFVLANSDDMYTSPDGETWTAQSSTHESINQGVISFIDGAYFLTHRSGTGPVQIQRSTDLSSWTDINLRPEDTAIEGPVVGDSEGAKVFCCGTNDGTHNQEAGYAVSADGVTWPSPTWLGKPPEGLIVEVAYLKDVSRGVYYIRNVETVWFTPN